MNDVIDNIIDILKKYEVKGSKFGLSRTRNLLNTLGSPDDKLKIVHVAGTNGKGSTCAYITNILTEWGKKVGTFTSPEVYCYSEKFAINGKQMSDEKLKKYLSFVYNTSLTFDDKPTAFEIETAAALLAFCQEGCEYAVVECGMGGLNDSTNAINKKQVAVITSISLEHTQILGDTLEKICQQKAGIIKNCPVVISGGQAQETVNYFNNLSCEKIFCTDITDNSQPLCDNCHDETESISGEKFIYKGNQFEISMLGERQIYNAQAAIETGILLGADISAIQRGLKKTKLLGRCEVIESGDKTYLLDGGHNPGCMDELLSCLKILNKNLTNAERGSHSSTDKSNKKILVYGCLSDKNVSQMAKILCGEFDKVYAFSPDSYRAMDAEIIYQTFKSYFSDVTLCENEQQALNYTLNDDQAKLVVVCGSFTILKEAKGWIEKRQ